MEKQHAVAIARVMEIDLASALDDAVSANLDAAHRVLTQSRGGTARRGDGRRREQHQNAGECCEHRA
jgi:hypothetical protein